MNSRVGVLLVLVALCLAPLSGATAGPQPAPGIRVTLLGSRASRARLWLPRGLRRSTERVIAHHTTPDQAGRIFARVNPRLAVYSHIVPSPATADDLIPHTRRHYHGRLEAGTDGLTIDIGDTIQVSRRTVR